MAARALDHRPEQLPVTSAIANIEAEAALLGALMVDNRLFSDVVERVSTEDFFEPLHQRIFETISEEIARGKRANPVTIKIYFENDPAMKEVGGVGYLGQLTGSGAGVIGARDFASQISELAKSRRLYDRTMAILADLREDASKAVAAAAAIEAVAYEESAARTESARSFSVAQSVDRVVDRIRSIRESGQAIGAVAPDIPELEKVIGAMERKAMIVIAGRPGMGKSALATSMLRSMAAAGYGCGMISLEMGDIDLGQRFAADVALSYNEPIKHSRIRDALVDDRELQIIAWCADQIRQMPLRLVDASSLTMSRVAMKARQMKRELEAQGSTLDVLVIDYLQLIHSDRRFDNKTAEVSSVSAGIKELAKELDCAVVALSQLSREVEKREDKKPQLSDLRESGSIEQDADVVCFLYREEYYLAQREPDARDKPREHEQWSLSMSGCRDHLDLLVPKRRAGATGRAQCLFIREHQAVRASNYYSIAPGALFTE